MKKHEVMGVNYGFIKIGLICALFSVNSFFMNAQQFNVLLFTKTEGYHHESINEGVLGIKKLALLHNFNVDWEENANVFNDENLGKYQCVLFLNTSGDILNLEQKRAFEKFIKSGKGFVGIHSAASTEYNWPFYTKMIGMTFKIHPIIQTACIKVEDANFPGMAYLPDRSIWTDEWYEYNVPALSHNLHFLISVDEKTYNPYVKSGDKEGKGMGGFHPIAWYQDYEEGRAFYTGLGHIGASYTDKAFLNHMYGGIFWAATGKGL